MPSASWLGQLIAAAWLSIALALFKANGRTPAMLVIGVLFAVMALVYGAALLRRPFDRPRAR